MRGSRWASKPASSNDGGWPLFDSDGSLDPSDWSAFERLCAEQLEALLSHLQAPLDRPVWRPVPDIIKQSLHEPLPLEPQGAAHVCQEIWQKVMPYLLGNNHPRFFGWVHGGGTPGGMLAELFAGAINANLGGREHAPIYVERSVIEWCRQIFGFPVTASGLLLSGTSMANLVALSTARHTHSPVDVREHGLFDQPAPLVGYTSSEAHVSVRKAFELLGLGHRYLRLIRTNRNFQLDLQQLRRTIERDRADGLTPFCVIGTAGTVNCGAIDDLQGIADLAERENLWFHVDGAFGATAILSDEIRPQLAGIERADSLAFDFHKWLHVPYDAGCVLIRDGDAHRSAFSTHAAYLNDNLAAAGGTPWFCEYGPELSRGFRALKVWFTLKEHGLRKLGQKISDNCWQARYLAELVIGHPRLELLAPVNLNIVCFRACLPQLAEDDLDHINAELVVALQRSGTVLPSSTRINGKTSLRINLTNHRTRTADLQQIIQAIEEALPSVLAKTGLQEPYGVTCSGPANSDRTLAAAEKILQEVLERAEFAPVLPGIRVVNDLSLEQPFEIHAPSDVRLGNQASHSIFGCAILTRHACELIILRRLLDDERPFAATIRALLAARTAALYQPTPPLGADVHDLFLPADYAAIREACQTPNWPPQGLDQIADLARRLLPLDGLPAETVDELDDRSWEAIAYRVSNAEAVCGPTEYLLSCGGDDRLDRDPVTGLHRYGFRPRPTSDLVSLASSTATTINRQNLDASEQVRRHLMDGAQRGVLIAHALAETVSIQRRILEHCDAGDLPGTEVLLCSSGTDAELIAACLIAAQSDAAVTNLVIAPQESGSGVRFAAAGRHFSKRTPMGTAVRPGDPIDATLAARISYVPLEMEESPVSSHSLRKFDRTVEQAVEHAVSSGNCLLHILDASKTGWGAPSIQLVQQLVNRHQGRLQVVVDACQMRLDRRNIGNYLRSGFLIQATGSKSFGGPPFCGALILPPEFAGKIREIPVFPGGLASYVAATDWPSTWTVTHSQDRFPCNAGLLLRWTAALREMQAFSTVPDLLRADVLNVLADTIREQLSLCPCVTAIDVPRFERSTGCSSSSWEGIATIFPFLAHHGSKTHGSRLMSHADMQTLHRRLNTNLTPMAHGMDPVNADQVGGLCHLGQPVELGAGGSQRLSALRLCTGAHVVNRVFFDALHGDSIQARLASEQTHIKAVFRKLAWIVEHWQELDRFEKDEADQRSSVPLSAIAGGSITSATPVRSS